MEERDPRPPLGTGSLLHTLGEATMARHAPAPTEPVGKVSTEAGFILHSELNHHCHAHLSPMFPNAVCLG